MIILDTDVVIEILDKKSAKGDDALKRIRSSNESIGITTISLHELLYGLEKYAKPVGEIMQLPVIVYGKEDAVLSARMELEAEKKGTTLRRTDAMIAAIAINRMAALFTFDKHFLQLQSAGLKLFK
jgi:predicted nucleic acid-binding protein